MVHETQAQKEFAGISQGKVLTFFKRWLLLLSLSTFFTTVNLQANEMAPAQVAPVPPQCETLGKLFHLDYRTFRSRDCRQRFENLRQDIAAAYNVCRRALGLEEVRCESAHDVMTRTWNGISEITNQFAVEPRVLHQRITRATSNLDSQWIERCAVRENGTGVSSQEFQSDIQKALREFSPQSPRHVPARRQRNNVPFQWMNRETKQVISTVAGGLLWRFRGGWLPTGSTQTARLLTVAGFAGIGWFNGGMDGAVAGALNVVPVWINGWGKNMDQGRVNGDRSTDFLAMTARGLLQTSLSGGYLLARGYDGWGLASGLGMGACYAGGYAVADHYRLKERSQSSRVVFEGGTSIGEGCTGAVMGLGLSTSLLNGTRNP